jgi:hypothetical protein
MKKTKLLVLLAAASLAVCEIGAQQPEGEKAIATGAGSEKEPIRYVGAQLLPEDPKYADGRLPLVVGVQNYQVYRTNRSHPGTANADSLPYTYVHAPMLAWWNGRFYLEFLTAPVEENVDHVTMLTSSPDGRRWDKPIVAFPQFTPEGETRKTIAHQRMGFYIAPNGRLLLLSFYGRFDHTNDGLGIGRAVREIGKDGSLGPIFFIRYNGGWNEANTPYKLYDKSDSREFVAACKALLANKLMTQQWWEEDRGKDGFFPLEGNSTFTGKALSFFHRREGKEVVGLWKEGWSAVTRDEGRTWSVPVKLPTIVTNNKKEWGQHTEDGRYAVVYNPQKKCWPLAMIDSDDGVLFDGLSVVHGEVPDQRFDGDKNLGAQYVRGIAEGNGNPPGSDMWVVYDVNQDDIWISRIPVPIRRETMGTVRDDFNLLNPGQPVKDWNIYSPLWAPVDIAEFPSKANRSLCLTDSEPYDYARAIRVFQKSQGARIAFSLLALQNSSGRMDVDITDGRGNRAVRVSLNDKGQITASDGETAKVVGAYRKGEWIRIEVVADTAAGRYSASIGGTTVLPAAALAGNPASLERLSFRTGEYRQLGIEAATARPNADIKETTATYFVDDVFIAAHPAR